MRKSSGGSEFNPVFNLVPVAYLLFSVYFIVDRCLSFSPFSKEKKAKTIASLKLFSSSGFL
jgi:hypothetical protein